MFGYATNEWDQDTLHPLSHSLANQIVAKLKEARLSGEISWLRPDCKSQVTLEYDKDTNKPLRCHNVLISTQHSPDVSQEDIESTLIEKVVKKVIPHELLVNTLFFMNPSKSFVHGGPYADAGLTGRKIIVDTYGGWAPHGGGAFSGKDPTKVDRSAAYYARYVAKSLVHHKLADRVLVQVAYSIGIAEPLSIHVQSFGTVKNGLTDHQLKLIIKKNFDFRPFNIITELNLLRPIYRATSQNGHFGSRNPDFSWEQPKKELKMDI